MAKTYSRSELIGGSSKALDGVDGANLLDSDRAIVATTSYFYLYRLNASSGVSETSPQVIAPDINPGDKRWELLTVASQQTIEDQLTLQGLTVKQDAKIKGSLEVLLNLILSGQLSVNAATEIVGTLTVDNDINASGNIEANGFTINGTAVGTSTDTYWNSDGNGNIYYRSGNVLGNPIFLNKSIINQNWTIPDGYNGMSIGPLDIDADITIAKNSVWEVL